MTVKTNKWLKIFSIKIWEYEETITTDPETIETNVGDDGLTERMTNRADDLTNAVSDLRVINRLGNAS